MMFVVLNQMKDDFNAFLAKNALWIALVLIGIIAITVFLILFFGRKKKKEPEVVIAEKSEWVEALGGSDNILSSEAFGSRLVLNLKDKNSINKDSLKKLGVTSIIEMSDKITLLLEDKAELVKKELDK